MYSIFRDVILRGGYNLEGLLEKLDRAHSDGKVTDGQRSELLVLIANTNAAASERITEFRRELGIYEEAE